MKRTDAQNLEDVKRDLYLAFNQAMKGVVRIGDTVVESDMPRIEQVGGTVGVLAGKIMEVEHELTVQKAFEEWKARGGRIEEEIAGGIVRDIKALARLKIKPSPDNP